MLANIHVFVCQLLSQVHSSTVYTRQSCDLSYISVCGLHENTNHVCDKASAGSHLEEDISTQRKIPTKTPSGELLVSTSPHKSEPCLPHMKILIAPDISNKHQTRSWNAWEEVRAVRQIFHFTMSLWPETEFWLVRLRITLSHTKLCTDDLKCQTRIGSHVCLYVCVRV